MIKQPKIALYIHIPWCIKKCPYCDFNSHTTRGKIPKEQYIASLLADFKQDAQYLHNRKIHSIFIGGGTPSLFNGDDYHKILTGIDQISPLDQNIEITMEANPASIEHDSFSKYLQAGINRVSIGVQSFHTKQLNLLGRVHSADEATIAVQEAQAAGYNNINIDLMHGLPQQNLEHALTDLNTAIALNPTHISWYQLTIEPNTLFHSKPPTLPEMDKLWDIQTAGQQLLEQASYKQYETSAYAKEGRQSQHNLNYWRFGDYIGIGCGAHGKISLPAENKIIRTNKTKHPKGYVAEAIKNNNAKPIANEDLAVEYFMNRARLKEKIPKQELLELTGINPSNIPKFNKELMEETKDYWQTTSKGFLFLNKILQQLINI